MKKEETLKERAERHYESRMEDLSTLWQLYNIDPETSDEELGNFHEYGLSIHYEPRDEDEQGYICYQISTGGPGEEFRFFVDESLTLTRVEFWFLDWFVGEKIEIKKETKEFKTLSEIYQDWKETDLIKYLIERANE